MRTAWAWGWGIVIVTVTACSALGNGKNDGERCTASEDCDSDTCNVNVNRCAGSECKKDSDCKDGWRCQQGKQQAIGRAPSKCVSTCGGCPVEWSCRAGSDECSPDDVAIAIESPAAGTILRRGEPARVHARVGPSVDPTFVMWKLDDDFAAHGNDVDVTPSRIGDVKLTVEVSTAGSGGPARGSADATFRVCEPQRGVGCSGEDECCAPLKCTDSGFGKKSCL